MAGAPGRRESGWSRVNWPRVATRATWAASIVVWSYRLFLAQVLAPAADAPWLLDWHVYAAGARSFWDRTLYITPLTSDFRLPVDQFNYPPLAAVAATPLAYLPDQLGGTLWVVFNLAAVAASCLLVSMLVTDKHRAAWSGILFCLYSIHPWALSALLGNNNSIVLLLVVSFAFLYSGGHLGQAGVVLGAAIGIKLWPVTMLALAIRDGRWSAFVVAAFVAGASGAACLLWLGLDNAHQFVDALGTTVPVEPGNVVLGISWLEQNVTWWPGWGGLAVGALLLAIPARGRLGLGLGMLAGLAIIPNLWKHYLPSIVAAVLIGGSGIAKWRAGLTRRASLSELREPEGSPSDLPTRGQPVDKD